MSVDCQKLLDLLIDFVSDEITAELRVQVERHLGECPSCVRLVGTYKLTIHVSRKLVHHPLPSAFAERLRTLLNIDDDGGGMTGTSGPRP
jgi:anti-sigma factor RsiW